MAITPLPAVPLRSDAPAAFVTKADAFLGALNLFATQVDAVGVALTLGATNSTSTTSLLIGVGSKSLTCETGKSYVAGMTLKIASTASPSNWMLGDITSYVTGTGALVINITSILGSGTVAAWTVSQSAPGGAAIGVNSDITSLTAINAVTFPATQVASANINTLDDYKEGTWTPVLTSGFTTSGVVTTAGTFTKIGRVVVITFAVSATSVSPASGAVMSGLPYPAVAIASLGSAGAGAGTLASMTITSSGSTLIFGGTAITSANVVGSITYVAAT